MLKILIIASLLSLSSLVEAGELTSKAAAKGHEPYHSIKGNFGVFSTVGELGLTYGFGPIDHLELEVGVGWGLSGTQISLMPKFTAGSRAHRYVCGVGLSVGLPSEEVSEYTSKVLWLNADLAGYEYRHRSGFTAMVAGGLVVYLTEYGPQHDSDFEFVYPQARVAVGWLFG